jgi:uncharacterized protein (DUF3820 family)
MSGFPLTFGRHKGKGIEDVPTDYLEWLAGNLNEQGRASGRNVEVIKEAEAELKYRKKHGIE